MESHIKQQIATKYDEKTANKLRIVRYADDFVVIHENREVIEESQKSLMDWLAIRGLSLSSVKTSIVHTTEGFDFLGFNIRHYPKRRKGYHARQDKSKQNFKTLIKPSRKNIDKHIKDIAQTIDKMKNCSQDKLIEVLNPKIQGWANYFKGVVAKRTFNKLDHIMWNRLWSWAKRRHPNKSRQFIANKYFKQIGNDKWRFATQSHVLNKYSHVKIQRHILVKQSKSVYDGDDIYWAERLKKGYGDISPGKAKLLRRQKCKCVYCNTLFRHGDKIVTHHKIHRCNGGTGKYENLVLLHKHCHDQYHTEFLKQKHEKRRMSQKLASSYREMTDIQAEIMGVVNKI